MVATARRKAERAKAFAEAQAKATKQRSKNISKKRTRSTNPNKTSPTTTPADPDTTDPTDTSPTEPTEDSTQKHRFILFIGNLPFNATTDKIKQHFASVSPSSIRHSTDRATGKSKGFAFLEFENYSRMDVCLRTFHHSLFGGGGSEDVESHGGEGEMKERGGRAARRMKAKDKAGPRRINVELTVGGGGSKSNARKNKLRAKNERLGQERKKRAANAGKEARPPRVKTAEEQQQAQEEEDQIHPSRRAKVTR